MRIVKHWISGQWLFFLDDETGKNLCSGSLDYCLQMKREIVKNEGK